MLSDKMPASHNKDAKPDCQDTTTLRTLHQLQTELSCGMERDVIWLSNLVEAYSDASLHANLLLNKDLRYTEGVEERHGAVISQVYRLMAEEPDDAWKFIELACDMPLSRENFELLGAGLFEDLMDEHGLQFIDRVEAAVLENANMRTVVDAVWTTNMNQSVIRGLKAIKASPKSQRTFR